MFSSVLTKIRALSGDWLLTGTQTFTYTTSLIFTLDELNATAVNDLTIGGAALDSGETYSYSATTHKVTVVGATPTAGDEVEVNYSYYNKNSDTVLAEYVRAALVYISIYSECQDYELETDGDGDYNFEPTPSNKQLDMIALVAGILINPNWSEYKLPNITIKYPRTQTKETKIRKLIMHLQSWDGCTTLIKMEA